MSADDDELVARLKAAEDEAWAETHRLAHLADLGLVAPSEFYAALEKAQTATKRYQAIMPPVPWNS